VDEPTVPAAAAPSVSSPLSSPSPAPAPSASIAAPAVASPPTPSSPAGTISPAADPAAAAAPAVTRPEGLPDSYWDATTNSLKVTPEDLIKDLKERDDLKAFKAADDVRRLAIPQTAEAYKVELPSDFKAPVGIEFKFDANDPVLASARVQAHAMGASQDDFSKMLGLYAAAKVGEEAQIATARTREIEKLGSTAPARVDAVTNWLAGIDSSPDKGDAKALAGMLVTARHVEAFERIINRFSSQGVSSFSQKHRDVDTGKVTPEQYERMSYGEKKDYAAKHGAKPN
jgi:hypothetical protein